MLIILFLLFTASACWVVKAELLNHKKDQVMSLPAGLHISLNPSKTIMMFSVSLMSRIAFIDFSEAQVVRLQMFPFRCP